MARGAIPSISDYESMESFSDEALELLDQMSSDAKGPVLASESPVALSDGTRGLPAEIDSPYSEEGLPILMFLPEGGIQPNQTIVWLGGLNAIIHHDNSSLLGFDLDVADFPRRR